MAVEYVFSPSRISGALLQRVMFDEKKEKDLSQARTDTKG